MDNATTKAVVDNFSGVLNREPAAMRKTMTDDQGREMHGDKVLTERTGVQIYFATPYSPWQRGSIENTNGLLGAVDGRKIARHGQRQQQRHAAPSGRLRLLNFVHLVNVF
jgi:hypothetical protein